MSSARNGGLRATTNTQLFTNTGSFYAVEVLNPQFSGGGCSATLKFWKREGSGGSHNFWSVPMACSSEFTLRIIMMNSVPNPVAGPATWVQVLDGAGRYITGYWDYSIASGQPGIGVHSAPAGNGISKVQLIAKDRVAPPVIDAPAVSAFPNKIEMPWKGVSDGGSGMYLYRADPAIKCGGFMTIGA